MDRLTGVRLAIAEFLGTFLLVFAGAGAIVIDEVSGGGVTPVGIGLSFGLAVMAAICIFGPVSGAHINPAITLALAAQGRVAWPMVPLYVGAQLLGAAGAAAVLWLLFDDTAHLGATLPSGSVWQALALEAVITLFLALIVLTVVSERLPSLLAGPVIGAYVALAATFAGPIAGASMNPARSFGPSLVSGSWDAHWVYWLGPIGGAMAASLLYRLLRPERPGQGPSGRQDEASAPSSSESDRGDEALAPSLSRSGRRDEALAPSSEDVAKTR